MGSDRETAGRGVWSRLIGPLVTLLVCAALWLLGYSGGVLLSPTALLCAAVAFATLRGRVLGGLVSTVIALTYAGAIAPLLGPPASVASLTDLALLALALAAIVFLVSSRVEWLEAQADAAAGTASTAERRAALVADDVARRASQTGEVGRQYEELRQTSERDAGAIEMLEAALDAVPQGIGVVDASANLIWWNRTLASLGGLPADARRGTPVPASLFDHEELARVLSSGETATRLSAATNGVGGTEKKVYVEQYAPIETAGGRFIAVTVAQVAGGTVEENAAPSAAAPPARRDPGALDADIIDTLRAPLAAIREYVWYMVAGPDEPRRRATDEYGSRVLGAAQQMDDRIQALAEYSRVLRGSMKLAPVRLGEVVRDALQGLEPGLSASGARIRIVDDPAPLPVVGDRELLTLAVTHLIGNAIKYVPVDAAPRVLVWLNQVDGRARLSVEDNGIGIMRGEERRLFGLFERLPDAEAYPGNGVGLAVVRAAVERMGGRVGLQSELGWGSRFWIELRVAEGAEVPAADPVPALEALPEPAAPPRAEGSSFVGIVDDEWRPI
ncbi:MAG: ATP-binding protein [Gemmatimonadota bacterium]